MTMNDGGIGAGRGRIFLTFLILMILAAWPGSPVSASDEKISDPDVERSSDVTCELFVVNSWQDGDGMAYQAGITLRNEGTGVIDPWVLRIDFGTKVSVSDYWNCEAESADGSEKGSCVIFTPKEYNSSLAAGGEVREIGIIFTMNSVKADFAGTYAVDPAGGRTQKMGSPASEVSEPERSEMPEQDRIRTEKETEAEPPLERHGALHVSGGSLLDEHDEIVQLKGVSTHGIAWYPQFVNEGAFRTLRDEWGANLIRLVLYTDENGGYCTDGDPEELERVIDRGVRGASELGMYVIIDWHVLHDLTPLKYEDRAVDFFSRMSEKYKDFPNVLYEICNEPNGGTSWEEIRQYAETVIPQIRRNAPDAVILVGTPTWSQDVDAAAAEPIEDGGNIMYVLHFYAGTHKEDLRKKLQDAVSSGLPVFISEFSITDASGDGGVDYESAEAWKKLINDNSLSYACWSLSDKAESSALLEPGASSEGSWTDKDLSVTGRWMKEMIGGDIP